MNVTFSADGSHDGTSAGVVKLVACWLAASHVGHSHPNSAKAKNIAIRHDTSIHDT